MTSFTVKLFDIGSAVTITGGPFEGRSGTVISWAHISSGVPDPIHLVSMEGQEIAAEVPSSQLEDA